MNKHALFSVFGIELEYMIVDKKTLDVLPISDTLFHEITGEYCDEIERDLIAWNNELVLHVLEFKTNGPVNTLDNLDMAFHENILYANQLLEKHHAMLMPSGAHPWMNPDVSMKLWPHGNRDIYEAYHRIFNCRGHGFANLQATHINLPFKNSEEFVALHEAIQLLMPIIPALTASTPFLEGKLTGYASSRLIYYGNNQKKIPIISGDIIPESITSIADYHQKILRPMYEAISQEDPQKILQDEWLNSRGAIARFDRGAIEIRIMDIQESPIVDIACIYAIVESLKTIIRDKKASKLMMHTKQLKNIYDKTVKEGLSTQIDDLDYLHYFDLNEPVSARELWSLLLSNHFIDIPKVYKDILDSILKEGNLSERLQKRIKKNGIESLPAVYRDLSRCLSSNQFFEF